MQTGNTPRDTSKRTFSNIQNVTLQKTHSTGVYSDKAKDDSISPSDLHTDKPKTSSHNVSEMPVFTVSCA